MNQTGLALGLFDSRWDLLARNSDPNWYFNSKGFRYWLTTIFDTPVEVHAFQLGLLVGLLVGVLAARHYPKTSVLSLLVLGGVLFGAFDAPYLCAQRTTGCAHIRLKPWYFLTGTSITQFLVLALSNRLSKLWQTRLLDLQSTDHNENG